MYNAFADDWQTNLCQFFKISMGPFNISRRWRLFSTFPVSNSQTIGFGEEERGTGVTIHLSSLG
jgi:hypothetical protein